MRLQSTGTPAGAGKFWLPRRRNVNIVWATMVLGVMVLFSKLGRIDGAVLDVNLNGEAINPVIDMLEERGIPYVFATDDEETAIPDQYKHVPRWTKPFGLEDLAKGFGSLMRR
jgi:hypothetical protein